MQKFIYYGAGTYAQVRFDDFRRQYELFCFCDRNATDGQTLFDLPVYPPSILFKQYPETPIVLTVHPIYNKATVQDYLTQELGVPAERIANYEPHIQCTSCEFLDNFIILNDNGWSFCCNLFGNNKSPYIDFIPGASVRNVVQQLKDFRNAVLEAISKNEQCACTGCCELKTRYRKELPAPAFALVFNFTNICNLKCIYCTVHKESVSMDMIDIQKRLDIITELLYQKLIDNNTEIRFGSGEITIHPQRQEILRAVKDFPCGISSNCIVYDESLAELIALGRSYVICSVDAGTRETYEKIRGADYFDKLRDSLRKYVKKGTIILKYIFLTNLNDNDNDVNSFIQLCEDIKPAQVLISRDWNDISPLNDNLLKMMARMLVNIKNAEPLKGALTNDETIRLANYIEKLQMQGDYE